MEMAIRDFGYSELIVIKGRVDQSNAGEINRAVESIHDRGKYNVVIDMGGVEYLSSAGMRALLTAQQDSKHDHRGQLLLAQLPPRVRDALDMAGVTDLFRVFDDPLSALEFAATLPRD